MKKKENIKLLSIIFFSTCEKKIINQNRIVNEFVVSIFFYLCLEL